MHPTGQYMVGRCLEHTRLAAVGKACRRPAHSADRHTHLSPAVICHEFVAVLLYALVLYFLFTAEGEARASPVFPCTGGVPCIWEMHESPATLVHRSPDWRAMRLR